MERVSTGIEELDRKLITARDLKEAIWLAETSGEKFYDQDAGTCIANLVRNVVTYWVEYSAAQGSFAVHNAYCHRMQIEEGSHT